MKKLRRLTIALFLILFALCAGALAELDPTDIAGTWELAVFETGGAVIIPAEHDMGITIVLHANFTVSTKATFDDPQEGTWAIAGDSVVMTMVKQDGSYYKETLKMLDGNLVVIEDDGTRLTYSKTAAAAGAPADFNLADIFETKDDSGPAEGTDAPASFNLSDIFETKADSGAAEATGAPAGFNLSGIFETKADPDPAEAPDAPAGLSPADVVGVWHVSAAVWEGTTIDMAGIGIEVSMTINEDSTILLQTTGEEDDRGTWVIEDGRLLVTSADAGDGEETVITLVDGNLVVEDDEMTIVFSRDKAKAEPKSDETKGILLNADSINHLKAGQNAYIALPENLTTPVFWDCTVTDDSVMALISDQYIMDDNPHDADGVGGTHWYYFKAVGPGECSILMMKGDVSGGPARHLVMTYDIVVGEAI